MSSIHIIFAFIILCTVAVGMLRILKGPTAADRMMAAQLFGTCGVGILVLLAKGTGSAILLDIALVYALLAALATMTFVRRTWHDEQGDNR